MTGGSVAYILFGLISLIAGGELLVRGAVDLARRLKISPMVIGLTVVAFGTSSPELAVSIRSISTDHPGISVGNILGSNIYNVLLVLGVAASLTPLRISNQLIRFDVPVMIAASLATLLLSWDGVLNRFDGLLFLIFLGSYSIWKLKQGRRDHFADTKDPLPPPSSTLSSKWMIVGSLARLLLGLGILLLGSKWLVSGGVSVAKALGVGELIIGLTVIAIGTSLPEITTSILAIRRGHPDMAVGNVVGSNLFNLLGVLGVTSLVAPKGITIPDAALEFDMLVMLTVAIACLPVFFSEKQISRWEGGLFLFYFLLYTVFLFLEASGNQHLRTLSWVIVLFFIPLTIITLGVTSYKGVQEIK